MRIEIDMAKLNTINPSIICGCRIIDIVDSQNIDFYNYHIDTILSLEISATSSNNTINMRYIDTTEVEDTETFSKSGGTLLNICEDNTQNIIIEGEFEFTGGFTKGRLYNLIKNGYIKLLNNDYLMLFRLNSEKNVVDKNLIFVGFMYGTFKSTINIKSPTLLIQDYEIKDTFNYIYIASLNRYYYVDNIDLSTKKITSLSLSEDVLMSHKDLILQQSAFIDRQENTYHDDIVDDYIVMEYNKVVDYSVVPYTTNIFNDLSDNEYNGDYIVMVVNDV